MTRTSAQAKFWTSVVAFFLAAAVIACGCDYSGMVSNQQNGLCARFAIAAATGFPFGPLDLVVTKMTHAVPLEPNGYYYEIAVQALQKDQTPLNLVDMTMPEPKSPKSNFSLTVPIDQNIAAQAKSAGGHYVVVVIVYYSPSPNMKDFMTECVASKNIDLAPAKHKAPVTPTPTPAPAQGQPPPPPPPPQKPALPPPPLPTPCPPGYYGDPTHGKPCMRIIT